MFQLLLIRHGQSANNAQPEHQRVPDPGLTPLGMRQAKRLAGWIKQRPPTVLYCSAFRRALETTAPIAAELSMTPIVRWDLFEQGGCYEGWLPSNTRPNPGMGRSSIVERFGAWDIDPKIGESGWYHGQPLETDQAAYDRAERVVSWIETELVDENRYDGKPPRAALIIHADFKTLLLDVISRRSPESFEDFRSARDSNREPWNTSVTELTRSGDVWRLDTYNDVGHLDNHEWTS